MAKDIIIKGANENNLKDLSVTIPRDKFVVFTGLSGSGKSSLAFDTIYAEGQRRYMESLSSYARQFLGQMEKPDVEYIEGLSPAISIDQKTTSRNPRSTVGTVTEIHDYLRLLYARIGKPHCPVCGKLITSQSVDQMVDTIMEFPEGTKLLVLAPVIRGRKGEHEKILERIAKEGFTRVRVDGEIKVLNEDEIKLEKTFKHNIEIVVDRIVVKPGQEGRISEACELAMSHGDGLVNVIGDFYDHHYEKTFSSKLACPEHGVSIEELEPRMFSFNAPFGACPACNGIGFTQKLNPDKVINYDLSIPDGALNLIFGSMEFSGFYRQMVNALAEDNGVDIEKPLKEMPKKFIDELLYGTGDRHLKYYYVSNNTGAKSLQDRPFEGVINNVERRYRETSSEYFKNKMEEYMKIDLCPEGQKDRLSGSERNKGKTQLPHRRGSRLSDAEQSGRNAFRRGVPAHKAGDADRLQPGGRALYTGRTKHRPPSERQRKAAGNSAPSDGHTLIVVEHDEDTMYVADHIVDIGPGAGINGGQLVVQGTVDEIKACKESLTGQYLSGAKKITVPKERRPGNGKTLTIKGARQNNLKNIDVEFPLGKLICVTGVSGSGKSSLINEILYKGVSRITNRTLEEAGEHDAILGIENIDKVIDIDQSPIGRTPRSNPATYTGMFTGIRDLFAGLPEAKMRGYGKGRFSFNVKGGRCEACGGDGIIKIEMHFLPDVYVPCEVCKGHRYNRETLEVKYKGKNIFDVLDMSVTEALEFFKNIPSISRQLNTLEEVGLGYIKLGQPSTQLSGGEAQRVKLATELSKRSTGKTLYILDEPTTGLHFADVDKLISVLDKLVDAGNTVVVIEHNLDVIKRADHIIDLGPDGGNRGGTIVTVGTPEEVAQCEESYTGQFLKKLL